MSLGESFFESLCRTVGFALVSADQSLTIQSWNVAAEKLLERPAISAVGTPLPDVFPAAVRDQVAAEARTVLNEGGSRDLEYEYIDAAGEPMVLVAIFSPILAPDGGVMGVSVAMRDITVRRHAVRGLRESTARIRAIVDHAVEGIVTIDEHGRIETFNPAAERMFGYGLDEVLGKNVRILMGEPFRSAHDDYVDRYVRTGQPRIIGVGREVAGMRKNGEQFPLDLTVSEIRLGDRRLFTGIVRDMTERKRLAERMARTELMATLGRVANAVAHHFNNILGGVLTSTEAALATDNPRLIRKTLERVGEAIGRAARITSQLLAFGGSEYAVGEAVELELAVRLFVERIRPEAERRGLTLEADVQPIPMVRYPSHHIFPVLESIVQNAFDAMSKGGTVRVRLRRDPDVAVIRIEDTGPGMSPDVLKRIFEPFFTTKGRLGGGVGDNVGLGLAAVHGLVEDMGGTIQLSSEVGVGTRVEIRLPLRPPVAERNDLPRR